jgi:hypothetical protein
MEFFLHGRVCLVNNAGAVLLDTHVAQRERVTDFRTRFSGVRPADLAGAPPLARVAAQVAAMVKARIIVGHAITNDLTVRVESPITSWLLPGSHNEKLLGTGTADGQHGACRRCCWATRGS